MPINGIGMRAFERSVLLECMELNLSVECATMHSEMTLHQAIEQMSERGMDIVDLREVCARS